MSIKPLVALDHYQLSALTSDESHALRLEVGVHADLVDEHVACPSGCSAGGNCMPSIPACALTPSCSDGDGRHCLIAAPLRKRP